MDTNQNEDNKLMITTLDNPFSPFTDFEEWNQYDTSMGYNTLAYIDRVILDTDLATDQEHDEAFDDACYEIVQLNLFGKHVIVYRNDYELDKETNKYKLKRNFSPQEL